MESHQLSQGNEKENFVPKLMGHWESYTQKNFITVKKGNIKNLVFILRK